MDDTSVVSFDDTSVVSLSDTSVVSLSDTSVVSLSDTSVVSFDDTSLVSLSDTSWGGNSILAYLKKFIRVHGEGEGTRLERGGGWKRDCVGET
jgi:hypothetical protein